MMGDRQVQQDALCYEFSLERHVPLSSSSPTKFSRGTISGKSRAYGTPGRHRSRDPFLPGTGKFH
jgi:hypothetical protein